MDGGRLLVYLTLLWFAGLQPGSADYTSVSLCLYEHETIRAAQQHIRICIYIVSWEWDLKWTHMNDISLHHHHHHLIQMWTCNSTPAVGTLYLMSCWSVWNMNIICKFNVSLIYRHIVIQMFHLIRIWSARADWNHICVLKTWESHPGRKSGNHAWITGEYIM